MRSKSFAVASLLMVAVMVLSACGGAATPQVVERTVVVQQTAVPAAPVEKTVVVTSAPQVQVVTPTPLPKSAGPKIVREPAFGTGDIPTLDPNLSQDTSSVQWVNETTVGLTSLNDQTTALQPGIASKWDISADGLTYTFHLMNNVPWVKYDPTQKKVVKVQGCDKQDRMVTAQDFAYGIMRALDPKTASPYAYVLAFVVKGADAYNSGKEKDPKTVGIKAIDAQTLEVQFLAPAVYNLNIIGLWVAHATPKWLIEGDDCTTARGDRWTETGVFQGYGPFTLKEWVHDSNATFVKNPFWPGNDGIPQSKIDEIQETFLDSPQALSGYEAGNFDVINHNVPIAEMDRLKTDPTLSKELKIAPALSTYYYGFNTKAPVVNDVRVRQALSLAIDRQSLIDNVTKANQEPAQWFCRPGLTACPTVKDYPNLGVKFDAAKAKSLLDSYLKEKNTTADKLDLTLMYNTSEGHKKIAEAIQQMWKTVLGVNVKVVNQEWKVYLNTIQDPQNTPQIWRLGWNLDYPDANNFDNEVAAFGGSANPKAGGGFNWKDDKFEALVKQAATEPDAKKRTDLYSQAEQVLVGDDAVMAPIYWYTNSFLTKPYVTRTWSNTGDERYEKWDIDMSKVK